MSPADNLRTRFEIVYVPGLCDPDLLQKHYDRARGAELIDKLTPEGLRKLDAMQDDLEHRMLFGEPDSAREQEEDQCPRSS
jgi:hypothetical protein